MFGLFYHPQVLLITYSHSRILLQNSRPRFNKTLLFFLSSSSLPLGQRPGITNRSPTFVTYMTVKK